MFTGIIEELGSVKLIHQERNMMELTITSNKIINDIHEGDSIAVNGTCLTVTKFHKNDFTVDVMPETFNATALKFLTIKAHVNLERAVAVGGRLGGHFVSGHVDTTGTITQITPSANAVNYIIKPHIFLPEYCSNRGSITIDGTSLTIFKVTNDGIHLALIPHTIKNSIIGFKKIGEIVNIEYDMLAKYIKTILDASHLDATQKKQQSTLTEDFLIKNGYM